LHFGLNVNEMKNQEGKDKECSDALIWYHWDVVDLSLLIISAGMRPGHSSHRQVRGTY